jgi:hypothetical protein
MNTTYTYLNSVYITRYFLMKTTEIISETLDFSSEVAWQLARGTFNGVVRCNLKFVPSDNLVTSKI